MTTSPAAPPATRAHTIFVVGMHRSGTSALARIINLMGAYLGAESELVPAHPSVNPAGHWERVDVVVEHDRFLQSNGFGWGTIANFDLDKIVADRKYDLATKLRAIVDALKPGGETSLVLKDPRLCLLLPVWTDVVHDSAHVFAVRDPCKVAASIMKAFTNSFTTDFLLALWQKYMQSALAALRGKQALFVAYEALIADTQGQHDRLLRGLHALGATNLSAVPTQRLHSDFDARLDRSEPSPHARLSAGQQGLYDWLVRQCGNSDPVAVEGFPEPPSADPVLAELQAVRSFCLRSGWQMAMDKVKAGNATGA